MPADLSETVQTIVWAAMRTQVEELKIVREQLVCRYGAQLAKLEKEKTGRHVNAEVEARLVSVPPSEEAKLAEFESIAADYEVCERSIGWWPHPSPLLPRLLLLPPPRRSLLTGRMSSRASASRPSRLTRQPSLHPSPLQQVVLPSKPLQRWHRAAMAAASHQAAVPVAAA